MQVRNDTPNTSAVGSKIWLYRSGHLNEPEHLLGYREVSLTGTQTLVQHFGLGSESVVDARVRLPDGTDLTRTGIAADRSWTISR